MVSMALVACGGGGGADDNVTPPPAPPGNVAPVAQAGPNQSVRVRSTVTLDGSKSTDADGDKLTYHWTLARPDGKSGTLEAADSAQPRFIAAELGNYVATLVVNDGHVNSAPASTIVTASSANAAPVANPGGAQSVKTGDTVQLDGTASSDADGDALTYRWSLATPEGSRATLDKPDAAQPAFKPDVPGTYVASLIVNDGFVDSAQASVRIAVADANVRPVANAGAAQTVMVGGTVTLDGSKSSDANGDALNYSWSLTAKPAGSSAVLASSSTVHPSLIADVAGTYVATLVVSDGVLNSEPSTVVVTATATATASVSLFSQDVDSGNLYRLPWPYTDFRSSGITCPEVCSAQVTVAAFQLRVGEGSSVTIVDLEAKNMQYGSPLQPAFYGLREGQVIQSGGAASFSLYFDWIRGAEGRFLYTFRIKETGQVFKYDLNMRTY